MEPLPLEAHGKPCCNVLELWPEFPPDLASFKVWNHGTALGAVLGLEDPCFGNSQFLVLLARKQYFSW